MSKIERMLLSFNGTDKNKEIFTLGRGFNYENKIFMPLTMSLINKKPVIEETPKYHHTGAKYGASKYVASLQSGKMHKIIAKIV